MLGLSGVWADAVFPDQARRNHRRYQDARRRADGLLTSEQITRILDRLGITQVQAAEIFGGGQNAFSKYVRGEVIQSVAMDRLVRLASEDRAVFRRLKEMAGTSLVQYPRRWQISLNEDDDVSAQLLTSPLRHATVAIADYQPGAKPYWHWERRQACPQA